MANRNVFETTQAELYPLNDSHDVKESSKDGIAIIRAILYHFHEETHILNAKKK